MLRLLLGLYTAFFSVVAHATCLIQHPKIPVMDANHDALVDLLKRQDRCPKNVFEFRKLISNHKLKIQTTLVANRGFHNPVEGSFSLFEMVAGTLNNPSGSSTQIDLSDFFFGHFTGAQGDVTLIADQEPREDALMIELIVWDYQKNYYNFYEMIGNGEQGAWFYRGDSKDIQGDIRLLHRQPNPNRPVFGKTLRCSGCHLAGGPILKELATPHNDWWQKDRKLPFGERLPDQRLARILTGLVPPEDLSLAVRNGIKKLENSETFQGEIRKLSLQETLRPLFCPVELNLASDNLPFDDASIEISIPSEFFVDSRLAEGKLKCSKADYQKSLLRIKSSFPETSRIDADHAWLAPVKAFSDKMAIEAVKQSMSSSGLDDHFILSVLAVDYTNPMFSQKRCSLLNLVPNEITRTWKNDFIRNLGVETLKLRSETKEAAKELLANLTEPTRTEEYFRTKASLFLANCQKKIETQGITPFVSLLFQRRLEAQASEISKNPLGQILEPGFRVIFPVSNLDLKARQWMLNEECDFVLR